MPTQPEIAVTSLNSGIAPSVLSPEQQLAKLTEENERLRKEVDRLRTLWEQQRSIAQALMFKWLPRTKQAMQEAFNQGPTLSEYLDELERERLEKV